MDLGKILAGIGSGIANGAKGVANMFGTGAASALDLGEKIFTGKIGHRADDFQKWITGSDNMKDAYAKSAGQALQGASLLTDIATLGAGSALSPVKNLAINATQGAVGGIADELAEKGSKASAEDATKRAAVGLATGTVSSLIGDKMGNAMAKNGGTLFKASDGTIKNLANKAASSTVGRGAIAGGATGALGGGLASALNGENAIAGALQGGIGGAVGGGTMAGMTSLGTKATSALGNKIANSDAIQAIGNSDAFKKASGIADNIVDNTTLGQAVNKLNANQAPTQTMRQMQDTSDDTIKASDRRTKAYGWDDESMSGQGKKLNAAQKLGKDLTDAGQATKDASVYGKLKGNTAQEMIEKNAIERLRTEYGYSPDDYGQAANVSEAVNKWYDNEIKSSGATLRLNDLDTRLRNPENATGMLSEKAQKTYNDTISKALAKAQINDDGTMGKYSVEGLEAAAKYLGQREQNVKRTNMNGVTGNIDPDRTELGDMYANARKALRAEINNAIEMDDITRGNLSKMLDDLGATPQAKAKILSAKTIGEVKSLTSSLEDARRMSKEMQSSPLKRSAAGDNTTNVSTKVANATGASNVLDVVAKPIRGAAGSVMQGAGKLATKVGNSIANSTTGATGLSNQAISKIARYAGQDVAGAINSEPTDLASALTMQAQGASTQPTAQNVVALGDGSYTNLGAQGADQAVAYLPDANGNWSLQPVSLDANGNITGAQQAQQLSGLAGQVDLIARAMEMAIQAGDGQAYSDLMKMYNSAYSQLVEEAQAQGQGADGQVELDDKQSKALAAGEALQRLSGSDVTWKTYIGGGLTGDAYTANSNALRSALGYLLSGASMSEKEKQSITDAYVPKATDSDAVKQEKLANARTVINNYLSGTGYQF